MKAEDTVMSDQQLVDTCSPEPDEFTFADIKTVAEAQAEISFKAGMKEVVEWLKGHPTHRFFGTHTQAQKWGERWQAKLKEWGIDG